jgi:serine/threonine-protein kinase RsbT
VAPLTVGDAIRVPIAAPIDVDRARREGRALARACGLGRVDAERLVLAVSELATNLLRYARDGDITLTALDDATGGGIRVESRDRGPGIPDISRALEDGFSTSGGLGSGLPAVRRLLDAFEITSGPQGTRVTGWLCTPGA